MKDTFKFIVPADIEKSSDGEWRVRGLASTGNMDQQGETIIQKGIDLSPIDNKKGILNWDHQKGPENTLGILDGYNQTKNGLQIEGRLFKNHTKAKAVKEIMDSLGEGDRGRMGLSVEGQIIERDPNDHTIIKKCRINAVALTMNPVNVGTYADVVKSMNAAEAIEFNATEENIVEEDRGAPIFTADQVVEIVKKALGVGAGYTQAPADLSGGDALATSDMESDKKKLKKKQGVPKGVDPAKHERCVRDVKKQPGVKNPYAICNASLKKGNSEFFTKGMTETLDKLQILYPDNSRSELWETLKDRLSTKYPEFEKAGIRLKQVDAKEREHKLYEDARQRSDYEENKTKTRAQLAEIAREAGTGKKEQAQIRAQRDAAVQEGEDREHVRPGVSD